MCVKAKKHKIKLEGILVQDYHKGHELLIGLKKDPIFGHVIVLGLGGIFTEVLKEVSIRKCPITEHDAEDMIDELRLKEIFFARGKKINLKILKERLITVSHLQKYHLAELDINPLIINEKEAIVVDARIRFE